MRKLLPLFLMLISGGMFSQTVPPPPPLFAYEIDYDGDGIVFLDLNLFTEFAVIPIHEADFETDLSGYAVEYSEWDGGPLPNQISFSNILEINHNFVYSGSGPEFNLNLLNGRYVYINITALAFDGDFDGDGIINGLEDSNGNQFCYDDDDDSDGLANFQDPQVLAITDNLSSPIILYPNPARGQIRFHSHNLIGNIKISEVNGKVVLDCQNPGENLDVSALCSGIYLVRLTSGQIISNQRLVIN